MFITIDIGSESNFDPVQNSVSKAHYKLNVDPSAMFRKGQVDPFVVLRQDTKDFSLKWIKIFILPNIKMSY